MAVTAARGRRLRLPRVHVTWYAAALSCLLLLLSTFYMWTAASSIAFTFSSTPSGDVYNELTDGFLHGHTYLPIPAPAGLLALSDPYNPVLNAPYNASYHDLSLWHGHFYSQWGPTPVLTLFLPFRITGLQMPESFAAALYAVIGMICAVALLNVLVDRFVPRTPRWLLLIASLGLALTNTLGFLLRRPVQYEVAISCGYCFVMAGLLLVLTSVLGPRVKPWRMGFGSLCLGLAIGGRPTLAIAGVVALAAALWVVRRRGESRWVLAYALGPFLVCALLLALYNEVRFGGFTNFGERYELAGVDQTKTKFYSLTYLLPGLFSYLLVPARLALTFPHAFLRTATSDPFTLPRGYDGSPQLPYAEPAGGVFTTMPITLLLLALPVLWWRRRPLEHRTLQVAAGLALLGFAIVALVSWALFGTTERYEVDFVTFFLIPSFMIWALLVSRSEPGTALRRFWAVAGVVLTLFGAAVGTAISFTGYSNYLWLEHPAVFNDLEDVTSPLATLATMVVGKPEIARVDTGGLAIGLLGTPSTEAGANAWLGVQPVNVTVISPGSRRIGVAATVTQEPGSPPLSQLTIRVSSSGGHSITVPVIGARVRLPVVLHWGLNRVRLSFVGTATSATEYLLSNIQLIN
jgi:hypothetical protein